MGALSGFLSGFGGTFSTGIQGAGSAYAKSRHLTKQRQEDRKNKVEDQKKARMQEMENLFFTSGGSLKGMNFTDPAEQMAYMQNYVGEYKRNEPDRKIQANLKADAARLGIPVEEFQEKNLLKSTEEEEIRKIQIGKARREEWNTTHGNIISDLNEATSKGFGDAYILNANGIGYTKNPNVYPKWKARKQQAFLVSIDGGDASSKVRIDSLIEEYQKYRNKAFQKNDKGEFEVSPVAIGKLATINRNLRYVTELLKEKNQESQKAVFLTMSSIEKSLDAYSQLANKPEAQKNAIMDGQLANGVYNNEDARRNALTDLSWALSISIPDQSVDKTPSNGLGSSKPLTKEENVDIKQQVATTDSIDTPPERTIPLPNSEPTQQDSYSAGNFDDPNYLSKMNFTADSLDYGAKELYDKFGGNIEEIKRIYNNKNSMDNVTENLTQEEKKDFIKNMSLIIMTLGTNKRNVE